MTSTHTILAPADRYPADPPQVSATASRGDGPRRHNCRRCQRPLTRQQSSAYPGFCSDSCHEAYRQRRRAQREAARHGGPARNATERRAHARLVAQHAPPADYLPIARSPAIGARTTDPGTLAARHDTAG